MNDQTEEWTRVGAAIRGRIRQMRLSKAELIRASGVSYKTLERYMAGEPIVRRDKERDLLLALRWPPDAFDRIRAGEPPEGIGGPFMMVTSPSGRTFHSWSADEAAAVVISLLIDKPLTNASPDELERLIALGNELARSAESIRATYALAAESGDALVDAEHGDDVSDRPQPPPMTGDEGAD